MNVLNYVDLPPEAWIGFRQAYPEVRLLQARRPTDLNELSDEPEVIFGNVPPTWAMSTAARGRLRWIQSVSAGTEDYEPLLGAGVRVSSMRGVHHEAIAQHVLTMMLAMTRALPQTIRSQLAHDWKRRPEAIIPLNGCRVGIVGFGGIGRALVRLLRPFDAQFVGVKEQSGDTFEDDVSIWPMARLDEGIATSDHVVLCLPLLEKYRGLIDQRRIGLLKPGAYFYNVARGPLVDQEALLEALRQGCIAGAALDVFEQEPIPSTSSIWDTPNLIITPHIAGHDRTLRARCQERFLEEFDRYQRGLPLQGELQR